MIFSTIANNLLCIRNSLSFKLPNISNKDALSIHKRLLRSAINKRNKELQHVSKELSQSENFLSKQLSTIDFCILNRFITSHNKKLFQISLNTQQKKLSSLTRNCNLLSFTSNETINNNKKLFQISLNTQQKKLSSLTRNCNLLSFTSNESINNLTQYELSQEEPDLLKAGLHFSIQPDKIRKSEIFTKVVKILDFRILPGWIEEIHRSFINNLKSEETKNQIKAHLSYLANSYFYNYKPFPRILGQQRVLRNLRKNQDIVITKSNKGNGVVILD